MGSLGLARGGPSRGRSGARRPLLPAGLAPSMAKDSKTYTSILYGNGPGFALSGVPRPNVSDRESSEHPGLAGGGLRAGGHSGGTRMGRPPPCRP